MRFRTALLLGQLVLITVIAVATTAAVSVIAERSVREAVSEGVGRGVADGSVRGAEDMAQALEQVPIGGREPTLVVSGGARYLAVAAPLSGQADARAPRYVIVRSLDEAQATRRAFQRVLIAAVAVALVLALVLSALLSRLQTRPIDRLVDVTRRIAAGDLQARAEVKGSTDLRVLADAMNHMARRIEVSQRELAMRQRIEQELALAAEIQASMLPHELALPGLDLAARMIPAAEIGGDYYDVLRREHGWLAIGDVAGDGAPAGVVMMMVQNVLAAVVQCLPDATPSQVCCEVNRVITDNVRQRLRRDEHVTLTLLRHEPGGRVLFAGAHEELVVWRARSRVCERIATTGTWLGVIPEIGPFTRDHELVLEPGDVLVLYTDGVTEARDTSGEQFGMERLCAAVERAAGGAAAAICDHVIDEVRSFAATQDDDLTVLVARRP